jgi:inosine-uridine nucleoside N-ribohydrolase
MHLLVYDCDNTMGIPGRDIDDGLALLYLLGRTDVHLEAITTTFGNGSVEEVFRSTERLLEDIHVEIPLFMGAASPSQRVSEASRFLAGLVTDRPGQVSLLATGALTNLAGAWELEPRFFEHLREVVIMGGLTEPSLFSDERESLVISGGTSTPHSGFLLPSPREGRPVGLPRRITHTEAFWQRVFEAWERVDIA